MGRAKLRLERLEPGAGRNTTYTKRRHGLTKKVSELSILCDIEIMLLTFSPGGRAAFFKSENSSIEEIITKFAQLSPQERAQRKLESLEVLKKAFKNLEHVINLKEPFGPDYHSAEDLTALAELLRARLSDIKYNLSCWTYMEEIESIEQLAQMKDSIEKSLFDIWHCKDIHLGQQLGVQCTDQQNFEEQLALHCADQFQQGLDFPFDVNHHDQQLQLLSWLENQHKQNLGLQKDLYFSHQGNAESFGSIPFDGYASVNRTGDQIDMHQAGHDHRFPMNAMDFSNHGHEDDFLMNVGTDHEHGFPMDFYNSGNEESFLDIGHGHCNFMDFVKTENDTRQGYDISRQMPRTVGGNGYPMDNVRTTHGDDFLMDFIINHCDHDMPIDFSQTGNEHGIPMEFIKFANDHGISMDIVKNNHFEQGVPGAHDHCMSSMHMLKGGHEHYITVKAETERKENLDNQMYEEHPDQSFTFPSLCDNTFQQQEHLDALENTLLSGTDNIYDYHDYSYNYGNGISSMAPFDEHLYPQVHFSSDDDVANDHPNFGASVCPITVT